MKQILDGNIAASNIAYLFSEMCMIYPITPSSPMASNIDKLRVINKKNLFNTNVDVIEMQSEAGVAGALHGALITGSLATTFTSSQGLLLMIPNMYKIAGEMLPCVIHVASRSLSTHALSIFGDHQDIYAVSNTGFNILASTNVFECLYNAALAHLCAIKSSLPFLHFFDGFRTSHEINTIENYDEQHFKKFLSSIIDKEALNNFKLNALKPGRTIQKGLANNEDVYFQITEGKNQDYQKVVQNVKYYMNLLNDYFKVNIKPFNYYGDEHASNIIVAMGSINDTIKLVVNDLNKQNKKVGLIEVHLYRPFDKKSFIEILPKSVKNIAVLDRTKCHGSVGEPLYLDVCATLKNKNINIVGGRYGLSSKNTSPKEIKSVYDMLEKELKESFTIGINDDITNLSLEIKNDYNLNLNAKELKIYGYGSDGMVSASKDILKIVGHSLNKYVQGYFKYDSHKSGGLTVSHLRISDDIINAPFYVENPSIVVVTKLKYLNRFNTLEKITQNGILIINTNKDFDYLNKYINNNTKRIINEKNIKVITINADEIANQNNISGKISKIIEALILKELNINDYQKYMIKSIEDKFKTKGQDIVIANINSIKDISSQTKIITEKFTVEKVENKNKDIFETINSDEGDKLPVSSLLPLKNGSFVGAMSKLEKRSISKQVPKWDKNKCIECNQCSFICPHAVIRPFKLNDNHKYASIAKDSITKDGKFIISISEKDCTGCGLCIKHCPTKCLSFGNLEETNQAIADDLFNNYENPKNDNIYNVRNSQFIKPGFEFSGACAGCGETSYIKLLTQLFKDKLIIANATGCSSIYGGSLPNTPYSVPWASSLFEDNAEFGYGMDLSLKRQYDEKKHTTWVIGGDGWAYDIGFGGIDHILSSNDNINILVLDTEVYSNTGGQMSKSTRMSAVAEFAEMGKRTHKKDLFKIAMTYPNVYVASISLGANYNQTLQSFKEAEEHDGPSIIIAYSPCVEQGIKGGMSNAIDEQKLAVECGYILLMRYNPKLKQLKMDSKEPDFSKFEQFLNNEVRYNALKIKDAKLAENLFDKIKENEIEKYKYYKKLSEENI